MSDLILVRAVEERMLNAWPALETLIAGDWLLRFANGYSKRANSATPIGPGADMDEAMIDHLIVRFAAWGPPAVARLTPLAAPGLAGRLARRGFAEIEPTLAMAATIDPALEADPRVELPPAPDRGWIAANAASYGGAKADAAKLAAILARIRPEAAFAALVEDGARVAWGIGVVERGWLGLQDVVVAPLARGRGFGRVICASLMAWARAQGAERAYLHVLEANAPARALYRSLGFSDAYPVRHWVRTG